MSLEIDSFITQYEVEIRLGCFLGAVTSIAIWEILAPRRELVHSKLIRWANNFGLIFLNSIILRLVFPAVAAGVAVLATENKWGLLNIVEIPYWAAILLSVVALDLLIYFQHVMMHAVPALWRLHRVHHADLDFDLSTGGRFHPIEIIVSMLIKIAAIIVLCPPVLAVVIFEILLSSTALFNHGNIRIPVNIDRVLRYFLVTPDMHRVHHSIESDETNSNFGFNLPWWDRLLGTYRDQPRSGHAEMSIGVKDLREERLCSWLPGMLALPFIGKINDYTINRRY